MGWNVPAKKLKVFPPHAPHLDAFRIFAEEAAKSWLDRDALASLAPKLGSDAGRSKTEARFHLTDQYRRLAASFQWLETDAYGKHRLNDKGRIFLNAPSGSKDEAIMFRNALVATDFLRAVAPDLFDQPGPSYDELLGRMPKTFKPRRDAEYSTTFPQRVETMLTWRKTVLTRIDGAKKPIAAVEVQKPKARFLRVLPRVASLIPSERERLEDEGEFSIPETDEDARRRVAAAIVRRQGQTEFRETLLDAYGRRCAVCGTPIESVLEAAHILPYNGPKTNHVANGILLRADIHTLFDLGMLTIDVKRKRIVLSQELMDTGYRRLSERRLHLPSDRRSWPSEEALREHDRQTGFEPAEQASGLHDDDGGDP